MQLVISEPMEDSLETIQALDQNYRGEGQETRIRMLSLLFDSSIVIVGC